MNTTFGNLQTDERYKKLQRTLKLAVLRKEHSKNVGDRKASTITTWPSISTINVDTLDSSTASPSPHTFSINSEVLASSNNLRNILLKKKCHNTKPEAMITSSVKQYHVEKNSHFDQLAMPPPRESTTYRTVQELQNKVHSLSNCEKVLPSLDRSVRSSTVNTYSLKNWTSTNTDAIKARVPEYQKTCISSTSSSVHDAQKIDRVFSKWKVTLNDQYELIIKGTLDCDKVARSKPVIRRYSANCVESKYKHVYFLIGNIVDERNGLPDYIRGKFYNGFPDDWENVYQIWKTYVSQGCPVTFRWPTPIADSDDDLKSELTDMTYAYVKNKKTVSNTRSSNLNKYNKTENINNISEQKETYNYSTRSFKNCEKNTSFIKPFISNSENDIIPAVQTNNIKSLYDEANKQNFKSELKIINPPCSSRKVNKFILQEDTLNLIIKNLTDKNCPQKYIHKIIDMLDCFDAVSYRTESECNNDSMISTNHETCKSETMSLQKSLVCDNSTNDNPTNTNKFQKKLKELKSCTIGHSDLGYGSIRSDSNVIQLSNLANLKPEHDNDSDKSESEIYAGIPKIPIERVLKAREVPRKIYKRKVRNKIIYPDIQKHATNLTYNTEETKSIHMTINEKKKLLSDQSCISITEDEMRIASNTRDCCKTMHISPKPQKITFSSHREMDRNNFEVYKEDKSITHVQNKSFNAFDAQRVNSNVFLEEQNIPYRVQNSAHPQFISDVDYTISSDVDIVTVSSARTAGVNIIASQAKMNQDFSEKPSVSSKLHRKFIEQTENEIAIKKSKPTIISSVPIHLKLKISRENLNATAEQSPSKIIIKNDDKQNTNIRPLEDIDKSISKTSIATKFEINDSHTKTTVDKREICPIINNESHNINSTNPTTNPTTEQPKSSKEQHGVEKKPKMLTTWMPKVVYYAKSKSELGLTFQGKLVNEAGHIVHRKYTTDIVLKRLSATLIETVNHELYELLGNLNDNKHIIPKELLKQCRYGCPAKIEQFCLTWKTLQHDNVQEIKQKLHDATVDSLNAPVSSRGRRILPPLCYWTGERITLKDNNPVYNPGNSQESLLLSLTDNSREIQKNTMDETKKQNVNSKNTPQKQSVNKQTMPELRNKTSDINKNQSRASEKSYKAKVANNARRSDNWKKSIHSKRRKLTFSSTDSNEEERKAFLRKRVHNSKTNENVDSRTNIPRRTMTLRKQKKNVTYNYYEDISQSEDFLSETEISSV